RPEHHALEQRATRFADLGEYGERDYGRGGRADVLGPVAVLADFGVALPLRQAGPRLALLAILGDFILMRLHRDERLDGRLHRQLEPPDVPIRKVLVPVGVGCVRLSSYRGHVDLVGRHDWKQGRTRGLRLRQLGRRTGERRPGPGHEYGAGHAGASLIRYVAERV